jgi:Mg2+ and Co2+ transporter CorA
VSPGFAGRGESAVDLEEALARVVELGQEELHIVRKRAEEKTPARDSGQDYDEMRRAADRLDHYARLLRRLHDNELGQNWRHESLSDRAR